MELITGAVRPNGHELITEAEAKLTQEDIQTIKNAIFKGAEESELKLFLHDCQRCGVHPLDRLIHPTIRTNKDGSRTYTAITSIDLFRSRAEDTGFYAGNDDPVFSGQPKTDSFEAKVTVWKIVQGQRVPFTATARWTEYKPKEGMDFMWQKMPHQMLGKCAEALALRKAFPRQLGKLYVKEEMEQAEASPAQEQPKPEAPKAPRKYKLNPVQQPADGDDAEKVPASVTDAQAAHQVSKANGYQPEPTVIVEANAPEIFKVLTVGKPKATGNGAQRYGIMLHEVDDAGNDQPHKPECAMVKDKNAYCDCGTIFFRDTFSTTVVENARKAKGKLATVYSVKNGDFINIDKLEVM